MGGLRLYTYIDGNSLAQLIGAHTHTHTHVYIYRSRCSSVDIVTRYGLDGPVIESQWGGDFPHPSRQALESTQLPIQWVPGLSRG